MAHMIRREDLQLLYVYSCRIHFALLMRVLTRGTWWLSLASVFFWWKVENGEKERYILMGLCGDGIVVGMKMVW